MDNMYCQKCRTPLRLDGSLEDLNPAAFKLLIDSTGVPSQTAPKDVHSSRPMYSQERKEHYEKISHASQSPVYKRSIPSAHHSLASQAGLSDRSRRGTRENPAMSFVMLTESQLHHHPGEEHHRTRKENGYSQKVNGAEKEGSPAQEVETVTRLFEILSARSDIDHPICVECTDLLVEGLQKRMNTAVRERDAYVDFLKQANADVPSEEEQQQARKELESTEKKEKAALEDLKKLEQEKAALEDELAALELEAKELDKEEEGFWRERNSFATKLNAFISERESVNAQYDHDSKQYERLQRTNVYNDTFCIGHDGNFATINGLRLGKLPQPNVDWSEINAAWGQTCLLLQTVAERLNFTFQGYRLVPMGSNSSIEKIEYPQSASTGNPTQATTPKVTVLPLHCNGDVPLGLGFIHRRFDNAMVAFLDCLRQIGDHIVRNSSSDPVQVLAKGLPYEIKKDKIGDVSIKFFGFNQQEETWTRACKCVLTCCKYLLAHLSGVVEANRRAR